jgi:CBS domain containing-hemolysin-like protein
MGGFVFGLLGRAPELGDEVEFDGMRFEVAEVEGSRIDRLSVTFIEHPPREESPEELAAEG